VVGGTINERGNNVVTAVNTALTKSSREFPLQPEIVLHPIGLVGGGPAQPQDDSWDSEVAEIVDGRFGPQALAGPEGFSRIEVVFHFHQVDDSDPDRRAASARARRLAAGGASSPSAARAGPTASA
jgi:hypothetical protein